MRRPFAISVCATLVVALAVAVAMASAPIKSHPMYVCHCWHRVAAGLGPKEHRVIVAFEPDREGGKPAPLSYAYDPVAQTIAQLSTPVETLKPVGAIGISITHEGSTARVLEAVNGQGVATFEPNVPPGHYNVIVSVPANVLATQGVDAFRNVIITIHGSNFGHTEAATLKFPIVVDPKGYMSADNATHPTVMKSLPNPRMTKPSVAPPPRS